jgi:hypothetical protein
VPESATWPGTDPIDADAVSALLDMVAPLPPPEADAGLFLAMTALSLSAFVNLPWREFLAVMDEETTPDNAMTVALARRVCGLLGATRLNAAEATILAVRRRHYADLILRASALRMGSAAPRRRRVDGRIRAKRAV